MQTGDSLPENVKEKYTAILKELLEVVGFNKSQLNVILNKVVFALQNAGRVTEHVDLVTIDE